MLLSKPLAILSLAGLCAGAPVTADLVKTGLYVISGPGGNALLRLSGNGSILVDGNLPGDDKAVARQVRRISELPLRITIGTAPHEGAAQTFEREHTLRLGGIEARVFHFGSARTSGDAIVYFPNLKVIAVGDLFAAAAPSPDYESGGSLAGWADVLSQALQLDFDLFVPARGRPAPRRDLEGYKAKLDALIAHASALVNSGVPERRFLARLKTDDLGWRVDYTADQVHRLYSELAQRAAKLKR